MSDEKKEIAANIAPELVETSEEPNVFDELQDQPQMQEPDDTGKPEEPEELPESTKIFSRENMSKKAPTDGGEKKILPEEQYNKKVFTIKDVSFTALRLIDADGNKIPPIVAQNKKTLYYKVKLCIQFEEDNIKEYYPSIYVFKNRETGEWDNLSIQRYETSEIDEKEKDSFASTVGIILAKFARFKKLESKNISNFDFVEGLIGLKCVLKKTSGKFNGSEWSRNDIVDFM